MESVEIERDALVSFEPVVPKSWSSEEEGETVRMGYEEEEADSNWRHRFNLVNHNYHGVDTSKYGEQK